MWVNTTYKIETHSVCPSARCPVFLFVVFLCSAFLLIKHFQSCVLNPALFKCMITNRQSSSSVPAVAHCCVFWHITASPPVDHWKVVKALTGMWISCVHVCIHVCPLLMPEINELSHSLNLKWFHAIVPNCGGCNVFIPTLLLLAYCLNNLDIVASVIWQRWCWAQLNLQKVSSEISGWCHIHIVLSQSVWPCV